MYEMGYSPDFVELMVFRNLLEALTWLEVQDLNFAKKLNVLSNDNCSEFLFFKRLNKLKVVFENTMKPSA